MGVPQLFPFMRKLFAEMFRNFQGGEGLFEVEHLYLDANPLLHGANQIVHNYGSVNRKIDPYKDYTPEQKQTKVFEMFFDSILFLSKMVVPTKTLYIAIDGPAPLAKQAQQRQRRFVAAKTRKDGFDSNSITPGTLFMFEMTKYIHTAIRKEANRTASQWSKIDVIFSPPTVAAEGEHKVLSYIREKMSDPVFFGERHCMFGPDGDLLMLTLAAHLPRIYLIREDIMTPGYYDMIDMGGIRKKLPQELGQNVGFVKGLRSLDDVSNDFILVGFFVGNDFLPKIQMFLYLRDGLNMMIDIYARVSEGGVKNHLTESNKLSEESSKSSRQARTNSKISHTGFTRFIKEVAKDENRYIFNQSKIEPPEPMFENKTLLKNIISSGTFKRLDMQSYRTDYYAKAGVDAVDDQEVRQICLDYLKSMAWVFEYYISGLPSWTYFYRWHYAPLLQDVVKVMESMTDKEMEFVYVFKTKGVPSLPFVQLISVLPPASAGLLPRPFRPLFEKDSPLAEYYPTDFEIDYEGKTKEHMGVVLLPFADNAKVLKRYQPIADRLVNRYVRNSVGRPELFRYDPKYQASYTSDYGDIDTLHVRKTLLD